MAVDIGAEAIDRAASLPCNFTIINKTHPASSNGTVTSIDIWARMDITGLKIGAFYATNGNTLKCRASEAIAGTITAGSKVTKAVSLTVITGDYIGCYFTNGELEGDSGVPPGLWYVEGEYIDPNDEATYTFLAGYVGSLGGYFEVPAVGRSFGFIIG
ncbi:hypothetical protein ES708_01560 [subsurface metagenome]